MVERERESASLCVWMFVTCDYVDEIDFLLSISWCSFNNSIEIHLRFVHSTQIPNKMSKKIEQQWQAGR